MIELKYCPHCGTPRLGRFCTGCGTDLDSLIKSLTADVAPPPEDTTDSTPAETMVAPPETPIASGEIPSSAGPSHTSRTREPPRSTPPGLSYPAAFDLDDDCLNCGTPLTQGQCELCAGE